jgi:hypothetical protein
MLALEACPEGSATDLGPPLVPRPASLVSHHSSLLNADGRWTKEDGRGAGGHDVVVFNVLDPAELNFDFSSPALFQDIETGRNMYVDPSEAQTPYKRMLDKHLAKTKSVCQDLGIDYHLFATNRPFDLALFDFLQHRMRRRKRVRIVPRPSSHVPRAHWMMDEG